MANVTKQLTGASRRQLCERELHRELRRANKIIDNAYAELTASQKLYITIEQSKIGITPFTDPKGEQKRNDALRRITPRVSHTEILAIFMAILFGLSFGYYLGGTQASDSQPTYTMQDRGQ